MHLIFNKKNVKYCIFFFFYIENVFGKLEHKKLLWNYLTMNNLPMQWGIRATIYKEVSLLLLLQYVPNKLALPLSWWPDLLFQTGYTNKVTLFFHKNHSASRQNTQRNFHAIDQKMFSDPKTTKYLNLSTTNI